MRELVRRIEAVTPPDRDRAVDALRALAVLGVVLGHWLVTALVADSGTMRGASPLEFMPHLAPVSWVLQPLAVFFFVGGLVGARGCASARARGIGYGRWVSARMARLFRPVLAVLAVWVAASLVMLASGVQLETVRTLVKLVLSPLWFLLVFAALTALTPLVSRLHPLWPIAVVLHVDFVRFGLDGGPSWLSWLNVVAGWLVPYCLGTAWARGELCGRRAGWTLLLGGGVAAVALVRWADYPASMVGVPGARLSNLDPPTLAVVCFGLAQCGGALLLREPLRRALARPALWAPVALLNLSAMTVFLWHQAAMMLVTACGLLTGRSLPGLHTVPDGGVWVAARLAWLPLFAGALLVCWTAFRTYEQGRPHKGRGRGKEETRVIRTNQPRRPSAATRRSGD